MEFNSGFKGLIITRTQQKSYSNTSTPNNSPTHPSQIHQILLLLLQLPVHCIDIIGISHPLTISFTVLSSLFFQYVYIHKNTDRLTFTSFFVSLCLQKMQFPLQQFFVFSTAVLSNSKLQALAAGGTSSDRLSGKKNAKRNYNFPTFRQK